MSAISRAARPWWESAEFGIWHGAFEMHKTRSLEASRVAGLTNDAEVKSTLLSLAKRERQQASRYQHLMNAQCGSLGISE